MDQGRKRIKRDASPFPDFRLSRISAAAAAHQAEGEVQALAIDIGMEQLESAESIKSIQFFPGSGRYYGVPGLVLTASTASKSLQLEGKNVSLVEVIEGL